MQVQKGRKEGRCKNRTRVVLGAGGKAWFLWRSLLRGYDGGDREEPGFVQVQLSQEAECRGAAGSRTWKERWTRRRAGGEMAEHHGGDDSRSQEREVLKGWFAELRLEGTSGLGKTGSQADQRS